MSAPNVFNSPGIVCSHSNLPGLPLMAAHSVQSARPPYRARALNGATGVRVENGTPPTYPRASHWAAREGPP